MSAANMYILCGHVNKELFTSHMISSSGVFLELVVRHLFIRNLVLELRKMPRK